MTWIKTNFLWMQYRAGWASKHNQEHVLAIWLRRSAFERYLTLARTHGSAESGATVRLQWDPDHEPNGDAHHGRRAVQLGLKMRSFVDGTDILQITDVTDFCHRGGAIAGGKDLTKLMVARERVFTPRVPADALTFLQLSPPPKEEEAEAADAEAE
jgi:hypothetical protein